MASYYDEEIVLYLKQNKINYFKNTTDFNEIVDFMMDKFEFRHGKLNLVGADFEKYIKSDDMSISKDVINFLNELFHEQMCNSKEKVIYIGDDLTEYVYEFGFNDLTMLIPYLINNVPQHHYFLFDNMRRLLLVSFENEILYVEKLE